MPSYTCYINNPFDSVNGTADADLLNNSGGNAASPHEHSDSKLMSPCPTQQQSVTNEDTACKTLPILPTGLGREAVDIILSEAEVPKTSRIIDLDYAMQCIDINVCNLRIYFVFYVDQFIQGST